MLVTCALCSVLHIPWRACRLRTERSRQQRCLLGSQLGRRCACGCSIRCTHSVPHTRPHTHAGTHEHTHARARVRARMCACNARTGTHRHSHTAHARKCAHNTRTRTMGRVFAHAQVFRVVTTAALLKSQASQAILGNETVAKVTAARL